MQHSSQQQLAQQVHAQARRFVLVATGGGSQAISALVSQPGASRTVLEATVPYSAAALADYLNGPPEEACSARTARTLAMAAYQRARRLDPAAQVLGIACTASLASNRPKRGSHRAHVAWQSATTTANLSLELAKGVRDRAGEEVVVANLLLNAVAEACQVAARSELPLVAGEQVAVQRVDAPPEQVELLAGTRSRVPLLASDEGRSVRALFPGAFHPLHAGHRRMKDLASRRLQSDVAFEISIENVDKPLLDFIEIEQRVGQFAQRDQVWLTRAPTFERKSGLFPGCTFVVGADTIERVGQLRYYTDEAARQAAFEAIAVRGCRFLVFGRETDGDFCVLGDLKLPPALAELCTAVPAEHFREDVSSTQLRREGRSATDRD